MFVIGARITHEVHKDLRSVGRVRRSACELTQVLPFYFVQTVREAWVVLSLALALSLSLSLSLVKFSSCLFVVCLCTSLYCFSLATVLRLKASIQGALYGTVQLYMNTTMEQMKLL